MILNLNFAGVSDSAKGDDNSSRDRRGRTAPVLTNASISDCVAWRGRFRRFYRRCGTSSVTPEKSTENRVALPHDAESPSVRRICFLGATGDLAYKKIFPALQAMIAAANRCPGDRCGKAAELDQFKLAPRQPEKHGGGYCSFRSSGLPGM